MKTVQHPALKAAPKSLREALQRIYDYGTSVGFGINCDERDGRCCPIGQFFTLAQRNSLKCADCNVPNLDRMRLPELMMVVGPNNIEAMTGMTIRQAAEIQYTYDFFGANYLLGQIKQILVFGEGKINSAEFKL